eukprot:4662618-Pyramimonas_sp.AAC.2
MTAALRCHWPSSECPSPLGGGLAVEACPHVGPKAWGVCFRVAEAGTSPCSQTRRKLVHRGVKPGRTRVSE